MRKSLVVVALGVPHSSESAHDLMGCDACDVCEYFSSGVCEKITLW